DGVDLPATISSNADDRASPNFLELMEDSFDVLGVDVQSFRRDDHVLLAAAIVEAAFGIDLTEVACVKPTAIRRCHTFAADQNLAVRRDHHVLAFDHFAERSPPRIEGMIHGHDRAGFSQAVALDYQETEAGPEVFQVGINSGTAGDERPKFPAQAGVDTAVAPPAAGYSDPAIPKRHSIPRRTALAPD